VISLADGIGLLIGLVLIAAFVVILVGWTGRLSLGNSRLSRIHSIYT